jgi:5'(3')-deoxyribonucleotidase
MIKKILYVDMDGVLVDFKSGINQLSEKTKLEYENRLDEVPGVFSLMNPIKNGLEVITELSTYYDIYILSTAPWNNPSAWIDKLLWIQKYLPTIGYKRLIISHHKNLNKGDYLISDGKANGVTKFEGNHIFFGKGEYSDWVKVYKFFLFEIGSVKIDKEIEAKLIYKIKKNDNTTASNTLYNLYKHILESVVLQYNVDLASKEHKILKLKAKKGFIKGIKQYDINSEFQLISHIISFVRDEILNYLSKRDGFKRLSKRRKSD